MGFISWVLTLFMSTGFIYVKMLEYSLKYENMEEMQRFIAETFLMDFWESGFSGKVRFILLHGTRFWALVLFGGLNNNKEE